MHAGYMACYKSLNVDGIVDKTAVRVGGAGISSTEIACFRDENSAKAFQKNTERLPTGTDPDVFKTLIQPLDNKYYFVISTVADKIQDDF